MSYGNKCYARYFPEFFCNFPFITCIITLYILAFFLHHVRDEIDASIYRVLPVFVVVANVLTLWVISAEPVVFMKSGNAQSLSLTLIWAGYALILIILGIVRQWRWVRIGGIAIVGISIFKLFVIDTFTLDMGYKVAAYLTLGVILLAAGFLYQRFSEAIKKLFLE